MKEPNFWIIRSKLCIALQYVVVQVHYSYSSKSRHSGTRNSGMKWDLMPRVEVYAFIRYTSIFFGLWREWGWLGTFCRIEYYYEYDKWSNDHLNVDQKMKISFDDRIEYNIVGWNVTNIKCLVIITNIENVLTSGQRIGKIEINSMTYSYNLSTCVRYWASIFSFCFRQLFSYSKSTQRRYRRGICFRFEPRFSNVAP